MREILFRGKRKDCKAWEIGNYSKYDFQAGRKHFINGFEYEVYPETVGQFTGLYDRTKWEDLTDAEKLNFYHQHYIGEDGMSVRFQHIDDVKFLWKGKKIFEGDIVTFRSGLMWVVDFQLNAFVAMDGQRVQFAFFEQYDWDHKTHEPIAPDYFEVIGNIHDNPELLEVTE